MSQLLWPRWRTWWGLVPSGCPEHPSVAIMAQSKRGQTGPVDGSGSGVEVGGNASQPTGSCPTSSPRSADEVGDLAFDDGSIGPVTRGPARLGLFGSCSLQNGLVGVDGDGSGRTGFRT